MGDGRSAHPLERTIIARITRLKAIGVNAVALALLNASGVALAFAVALALAALVFASVRGRRLKASGLAVARAVALALLRPDRRLPLRAKA